MQLPGFAIITGMTVLAAIGDISRFSNFKKLSSYSGLVPGVEQSGTKMRGKGITKQGREDNGRSSATRSEVGSTLGTASFGSETLDAP